MPHEQLKTNNLLVEFDESLGSAVFVSHEWVGHHHPDPECKQLRVLQDALKHMLSDLQQIPLDAYTENYFPSAQPLPAPDLRVAPLYIWYDYFSCPQLEFQSLGTGPDSPRPNLTRAVDSIPAYIARCKFFFALALSWKPARLEKCSQHFLGTLEHGAALRESCESWRRTIPGLS